MLKKVLLMSLVVLFMFSISALFAQSEYNGKDPDDMRSYSEVKKEGMTKRTVIINGKVVTTKQSKARLTLREQKKMAVIQKLRAKSSKDLTHKSSKVTKDLRYRVSKNVQKPR